VVGADGEAVVGWIAKRRAALRTVEADAKAIEALDEGGGRARAWRGLLDADVRRLRCNERAENHKTEQHAREHVG
jgi:hypothetical protein